MSKENKKIFIGVAWPYVNGDLHIGHMAGYLLPADIYARFWRLRGADVLMASGSDCHGTPITVEAEERGISPEELVEEYHPKHLRLFAQLGLTFDIFTKTTTENHREVVQDLLLTAIEKGYVFKDTTEQYWSPDEERFLPDRYVEGTCPHCGYEEARSDQCDECGKLIREGELKNPTSKTSGGEVELKETEHYFFDWPKLQDFLEYYVEGVSDNWRKWVREETKGWLKEGLEPRAITRDMEWGIDIPKDVPDELKLENAEEKSIYVWFEAVIGYLSASVEWSKQADGDWEDFWKDYSAHHVYFMGKDNLPFHTLFWPGQLRVYSEELCLPDLPAINQFLQLEGKQFSKSRGVTIDSSEMVEEYGLDPVRFYLTYIMPENNDSSFVMDEFVQAVNSVLIGNLGNFVNRTLTLAKDLELDISHVDEEIREVVDESLGEAADHLEKAEFKKYLKTMLALSDAGNKYLSDEKPWEQNETEKTKILSNAVYILLGLLPGIRPVLPGTYEKLSEMLGVEFKQWPKDPHQLLEMNFKELEIGEVEALFEKIE